MPPCLRANPSLAANKHHQQSLLLSDYVAQGCLKLLVGTVVLFLACLGQSGNIPLQRPGNFNFSVVAEDENNTQIYYML